MRDLIRFNNTQPAHHLQKFLTPETDVFVVHHLGIPEVISADWYLTIDGMVEQVLQFDLATLDAMPAVRISAVHECAGSPLHPDVPVRRVANVEWAGVRLKSVLDLAGVKSGATHVWATGADAGVYVPTGHVNDCYRKDMPLYKAMADEVMIATHLNGERLSLRHGAPARLVVPGFYGTNSVKWLTGISLQPARAQGHFTTTLYSEKVMVNGLAADRPVWQLAPQSIIVSPQLGAHLDPGIIRITGWAWADAGIVGVEVSTDGGHQWHTATLQARVQQSWQAFAFAWQPSPGAHTLMCRATDSHGNTQPHKCARNEVMQLQVTSS